MKNKILYSVLRWIPALIIFSVSWYLSSQEHIEKMPSFWNADKLVHFVCFGGLCFWVSFACRIKYFSEFWISTLIVSLYGIIDEIHQSFVFGRNSSFYDWLADVAGAVFGSLIFIVFLRVLKKIRTKKNTEKKVQS